MDLTPLLEFLQPYANMGVGSIIGGVATAIVEILKKFGLNMGKIGFIPAFVLVIAYYLFTGLPTAQNWMVWSFGVVGTGLVAIGWYSGIKNAKQWIASKKNGNTQ